MEWTCFDVINVVPLSIATHRANEMTGSVTKNGAENLGKKFEGK
jgi:hypothetical protein